LERELTVPGHEPSPGDDRFGAFHVAGAEHALREIRQVFRQGEPTGAPLNAGSCSFELVESLGSVERLSVINWQRDYRISGAGTVETP
jgi:hypothetical protein